jgi:hypothetical protein
VARRALTFSALDIWDKLRQRHFVPILGEAMDSSWLGGYPFWYEERKSSSSKLNVRSFSLTVVVRKAEG